MSTTAAAVVEPEAEDYRRMVNEAVAEEVRAALARKRITQSRLGEILNLGQSAVSRRLSGEVPFDVVEINRIAEVTGVDAGLLIRIGSFSPWLSLVEPELGQCSLFAHDGTPLVTNDRPALASVGGA